MSIITIINTILTHLLLNKILTYLLLIFILILLVRTLVTKNTRPRKKEKNSTIRQL